MIKKKDRWIIVLSSLFYVMLGVFFTGSFLWLLLLIPGVYYIIKGGKKDV